jgi:hypothetical protein
VPKRYAAPIPETKVTCPRGEDTIYFGAAKNRYVGSVSLGYGADGKRIRRKVSGKAKQEVRDTSGPVHDGRPETYFPDWCSTAVRVIPSGLASITPAGLPPTNSR